MFAAFRGELFKVVRRPGVWVLVIVLLVLAILIGYAITWLIYTFPPKGASQGLPAGTTIWSLLVAKFAGWPDTLPALTTFCMFGASADANTSAGAWKPFTIPSEPAKWAWTR